MYMYEVCAKCGHVGRSFYVEKIFTVKAENGREAAEIVRNFPRVKHHQKDAIRYVRRIDEARYWEIKRMNDEDPYLHCCSIQEQRRTCSITPIPEKRTEKVEKDEKKSCKRFYDGKKVIRNPKKYYKNYDYEERITA